MFLYYAVSTPQSLIVAALLLQTNVLYTALLMPLLQAHRVQLHPQFVHYASFNSTFLLRFLAACNVPRLRLAVGVVLRIVKSLLPALLRLSLLVQNLVECERRFVARVAEYTLRLHLRTLHHFNYF